MVFRGKKDGRGYINSYYISIGSKEARDLNLLDENNETKELIDAKCIDDNNIQLTFKKINKKT